MHHLFLSFLTIMFCASAASAVTLLDDDRFTRAVRQFEVGSPFPDEDITETPAAPFAPFDSDLDLAEQSSSLALGPGGHVLTGSVSADVIRNFPTFEAFVGHSVFSITFEIEGAGTYALSGLLDASPGADSSSSVQLIGPSGVVFEQTHDIDPESGDAIPTPFDANGALAAGLYELRGSPECFRFGGPRSCGASLDMTFRITDTVPEPGTALLLATGLIALARARRPAATR